MRIIGGKYRGKKLITPSSNHIRPTTDRMRESLFNILEHGTGPGIIGSRILDLYAGSGALGIEALSRGAADVTFVDNDRKSISLIKQNTALINSPENTSNVIMDGLQFINNGSPYDLIFLDPPYYKEMIGPTLKSIERQKMLATEGCVIIEYASDEKIDFTDHFKELKSRKMGDATFSILAYNASTSPE